MNKALKATSLTIQLESGQKIELSLEEARDLYAHFEELFGKKIQYGYPVYIPVTPWIIPYYTPYCGTASDSTGYYHDKLSTGIKITYYGELLQQ